MALTVRKLHSCFAAEVGPIELRRAYDADTLAGIRTGMDEYAVLVFRDQPFTGEDQLASRGASTARCTPRRARGFW